MEVLRQGPLRERGQRVGPCARHVVLRVPGVDCAALHAAQGLRGGVEKGRGRRRATGGILRAPLQVLCQSGLGHPSCGSGPMGHWEGRGKGRGSFLQGCSSLYVQCCKRASGRPSCGSRPVGRGGGAWERGRVRGKSQGRRLKHTALPVLSRGPLGYLACGSGSRASGKSARGEARQGLGSCCSLPPDQATPLPHESVVHTMRPCGLPAPVPLPLAVPL